MLFRIGVSKEIVDLEVSMPGTFVASHLLSIPLNVIQKANQKWENVWFDQFEFNRELEVCKICKERGGK